MAVALTLAFPLAPGKARAQDSLVAAPVRPIGLFVPRPTGLAGPVQSSVRIGFLAQPLLQDTTPRRQRPRAIEYSDWYARRLTIHRWASYAMLPLFAAQYVVGEKLLTQRYAAPNWARRLHPALADGIATLFTVNTVTGLWNLWDSRHDPADRVRRTLHSLLMLSADAGFLLVGQVQTEGGISDAARQQHKQRAIASMSVAALGWLVMLPPFRKN